MDFVKVKAQVISDSTGARTEIPTILTSNGILQPLTDYLIARSHDRSVSWMLKVVQATMLFLAYTEANAGNFQDPTALFRGFVQRLHTGTVGLDGLDPSGLFWEPLSAANARTLTGALTEFSAWLETNRGAILLNPETNLSNHDRALDELAREYRRNRSFLGHVQDLGHPQRGRSVRSKRSPKVDEESAVAFPTDRFEQLITTGFSSGGKVNLRSILIALLMQGAGLRLSECFHLWVHDVAEDPSDPSVALVRIHHPSLGAAPLDWLDDQGRPRQCNRSTYLRGRYGLAPRTQLVGTRRAGWKNPMLDGKHFMQAYWFPADYGRLFLRLWKAYLRQVAAFERTHPFAFINLSGAAAGQMYCLESFKTAHARAVRRCGLTPSKAAGTTPHGHRHSYGRMLRRAGLQPRLIQKAMHHKALGSQAVYTAPSLAETSDALNSAFADLGAHLPRSTIPPTLEQLMAHGFEDVDPDGLLSGTNPKLVRGAV
ncbi:gamma-mobile-trio recombinase GmtY [Paraburkholderia graminis]|uniref:Integrase n=1 Tax=Paraburkholderia graminis TaxID=60548 RepID=A0ABD5CKB4_9BURK|nr:gamma-mobile-trio recombinase GmtY [Paraburkholderia graminis]MDR6205428.1 integrase [Paraburkholderia graminis]